MTRLVALALMLAAARADAQPAPDPAALEASGSKHFELAEYAAAIADFKEAFRISDRPELLFNIAQAYRLSGDCAQARTFYKTFLRRIPDAPNAAQVKGRIDELEACANAATTPPPVIDPPPPAITPPPPPVAASRTWKTKAGLASVGAGVLGVGLGAVFAVRGNGKQAELAEACAVECSGETARTLDDAGNAANRNAVIGFVAGGAFLAAGVVLVVLDRPVSHETGPSLSVGASGATAAWRWRF